MQVVQKGDALLAVTMCLHFIGHHHVAEWYRNDEVSVKQIWSQKFWRGSWLSVCVAHIFWAEF